MPSEGVLTMKIVTKRVTFSTKGSGDFIDITARISSALESTEIASGNILIFAVGSTGAITTFEYEPGLVSDMKELYERLAPAGRHYYHDDTWGDANGFSHLRASIAGPSLVVPFENGRLLLGTWQQIVFAEFDNRPREREVVVQITGE
jgi:secondary thiamine-phosphate synthase enzyme